MSVLRHPRHDDRDHVCCVHHLVCLARRLAPGRSLPNRYYVNEWTTGFLVANLHSHDSWPQNFSASALNQLNWNNSIYFLENQLPLFKLGNAIAWTMVLFQERCQLAVFSAAMANWSSFLTHELIGRRCYHWQDPIKLYLYPKQKY